MRTDTFLESLKTVKKNKDVLAELDKKLIRLSVSLLFVLLNAQTSYDIVQIALFLINWLISIRLLFVIDVSSSQHQIF